MAWAEQWSIKVDGNEVNSIGTGGPYSCMVPEVGWVPERQVLTVDRDWNFPVAVGLQPMGGNYTFLIAMKSCNWATWHTQSEQLKSWFSIGAHTFTFQVRGMPTPKSVVGIVRGIMDSPVERRVTVLVTVPEPVLT